MLKNTKMSSRKETLGEGIKLSVDTIHIQLRHLQGKILTIIEASIVEPNQLKAVKDLIRNDFSNQMMYVEQLCYPEVKMLTTDQAESILIDTPSLV